MDISEQQPVLTVRGVSKFLGGRRILKDISFDVYPGEIFGFLGPNGSGKTTTIKLILGLLRLEVGDIRICGHSVRTDFEGAMASVGGIIENPEMYKYLTGRENLMQYARMYEPHVSSERVDELAAMVGLSGRINDKIGKYSLGMKQRLGVAQALLCRPKLLVLDEPTNGLDPAGIHDLRELLRRVAHEEGTAVFVSSHLLAEMDLMCDRVAILDGGKVIGVQSVQEMHENVTSSDGTQFRIATAMPDRASEILAANGGHVDSSESENDPGNPDSVLLTVTVGKDAMREILKQFAISDVEFHSVTPIKRTLEDAFIAMTRGDGATPKTGNAEAGGNTEPGGDAETEANTEPNGDTASDGDGISTENGRDGKDGEAQ